MDICKDCGTVKNENKCKGCSAKLNVSTNNDIGLYIGIGIGVLAVMLILLFAPRVPANQTPLQTTSQETSEELRMRKINEQFSGWDGSHYALTDYIKKSMNDPDSYEHVQTLHWDMKDYLIVSITYRGSNIYGAIVTNTVKAKISLDGYSITILEQY